MEADLFGNVEKKEYDKKVSECKQLKKQVKNQKEKLNEYLEIITQLAEKANYYDERYDNEFERYMCKKGDRRFF